MTSNTPLTEEQIQYIYGRWLEHDTVSTADMERLFATLRRLRAELQQAQKENKWLRRFHEAGCPAISDDDSDAVLADYQQCACQFEPMYKWHIRAEAFEECAKIAHDATSNTICEPLGEVEWNDIIAGRIRARAREVAGDMPDTNADKADIK